jgi:hypothetical protein
MYRDFLEACHEGLQHIAYWTHQFDADLERLTSAGYSVGQSGEAGGPDGRFVYFDTEDHPGTVVELSEISGTKGSFFEMIASAAREWDGSNPVRRMGMPGGCPWSRSPRRGPAEHTRSARLRLPGAGCPR